MEVGEYYDHLKKYNYIRELHSSAVPPAEVPVPIRFSIHQTENSGSYPDYDLIRVYAGQKRWTEIETAWLRPAFDALLLFFDHVAKGASGLWVELYDPPDAFVDLSFECCGTSDLGLFKILLPFQNDEIDTSTIPGTGWHPGIGPSITTAHIVSATQICTEFFHAMRLAYGEQLLRNGRSLISEFYEDALDDLNLHNRHPSYDTTDIFELGEEILESLAYWNWIRSFPGLFPSSQPPLSLSDFLTASEIEVLPLLSGKGKNSPIPAAPLSLF